MVKQSRSEEKLIFTELDLLRAMDRGREVMSGSGMVPGPVPVQAGQTREQALVCLLGLAHENPGFLTNVAALIKVTVTTALIGTTTLL